MNIRRKWSPELPKVNIIFKKYKEKREKFFNPTRFLEEFDCEKYFELLKDWKIKSEESYLNERPYLLFSPRRHKKFFGKPRPWNHLEPFRYCSYFNFRLRNKNKIFKK